MKRYRLCVGPPHPDESGVGVLSTAVFGHNVCWMPSPRGVEYVSAT